MQRSATPTTARTWTGALRRLSSGSRARTTRSRPGSCCSRPAPRSSPQSAAPAVPSGGRPSGGPATLGEAETFGPRRARRGAHAAALAGVVELGAASEGEKTMVDALMPAVRVLRERDARARPRGSARRRTRGERAGDAGNRAAAGAQGARPTWASVRSAIRIRSHLDGADPRRARAVGCHSGMIVRTVLRPRGSPGIAVGRALWCARLRRASRRRTSALHSPRSLRLLLSSAPQLPTSAAEGLPTRRRSWRRTVWMAEDPVLPQASAPSAWSSPRPTRCGRRPRSTRRSPASRRAPCGAGGRRPRAGTPRARIADRLPPPAVLDGDTILVARELGPAEVAELDLGEGRIVAVALAEGSATSHAAIVARSLGADGGRPRRRADGDR